MMISEFIRLLTNLWTLSTEYLQLDAQPSQHRPLVTEKPGQGSDALI